MVSYKFYFYINNEQSYFILNRLPRRIKRSTSVPSVLSVAEYERIKQNAKLSSEDEEQNAQKILSQQRLSQLAKDKAHVNLIKEIDKKRPQYSGI